MPLVVTVVWIEVMMTPTRSEWQKDGEFRFECVVDKGSGYGYLSWNHQWNAGGELHR